MAGCGGDRPAAPTVAGGEIGHAAADNQPPVAVFKVRPAADAGGRISGPSPLHVTFNTCQSSDPDPGDLLKTTYDYDGDGTVDYSGHCRQTRAYDGGCTAARVCVTDRVPGDGHTVCKTYEVCVAGAGGGGGQPAPTPGPPGTWVFTQQGGASWTQPAAGTVRIGFQDSDDCGGSNGQRQLGTATMTLTLTQTQTLSVTMSGLVEMLGTPGLDRGTVTVDGAPLLDAASTTTPGAPCAMTPMGLSGSVVLGPGTHTIVASGDTVDGTSHVGGFWSFAVALN
jgi:hypothetical protein